MINFIPWDSYNEFFFHLKSGDFLLEMARNMLGYVLFVCCVFCGVAEALYCDPRKYVYNRKSTPNECARCDKCVIGEGKITLEESGIQIDPEFGSRSCIPCRPCKDNTFSATRSNDCQRCTNCTAFNKQTISPCTIESDAVCGGPLPVVPVFEMTTSGLILTEGLTETGAEGHVAVVAAVVLSSVAVVMILIVVGMMICFCKRKRLYDEVSQHSDDLQTPSCNTSGVPNQEPVVVVKEVDETKTLTIPKGLRFIKAQNDQSSGTSTDDEQKPLLKRKRMKRRSSLPARVSRPYQGLRRHSYFQQNINQYGDLTVDAPDTGVDENGISNGSKTIRKLMRSLSYPYAAHEKPLPDDSDCEADVDDDVFIKENNVQAKRAVSVEEVKKKSFKTDQSNIVCSCDPGTRLSNQGCYLRHLSKYLCPDNLYLKFSEKFLTETNIKIIKMENETKNISDRAWAHVEKVFQVNIKLTKNDVHEFLEKEGKHDFVTVLNSQHAAN